MISGLRCFSVSSCFPDRQSSPQLTISTALSAERGEGSTSCTSSVLLLDRCVAGRLALAWPSRGQPSTRNVLLLKSKRAWFAVSVKALPLAMASITVQVRADQTLLFFRLRRRDKVRESNFDFSQVGQCGNQVGHALLDALHTHSAPSSHFRGKERSIARAVLVDTEPKAVEGVLLSAKKWRYSKSSVVRTGSGGGASNNWGCGFAEHGPAFADATLEALRREAEACDHLMSIVLSQSAAGGTGSGLGTYITQIISDEYPRHTRINCVVCPNRGGEVIVQSYNMCLTLARLKADAHAIIALENEEISAVCKQVSACIVRLCRITADVLH
jgi:hypothetical protein